MSGHVCVSFCLKGLCILLCYICRMIIKKGSQYQVRSSKGKLLGTHPTKEKAQKQLIAIEISKAQRKK